MLPEVQCIPKSSASRSAPLILSSCQEIGTTVRIFTGDDPPNQFDRVHREADHEHLQWDDEYLSALQHHQVEYLADNSRTIVSENDSPDIPFRYSLNPYRGCIHGCAYCYARVSHEYLGYNAGSDFQTRIIVKHKAPLLFRDFLARPQWQPERIAFSGITDCYQPAERKFRLTRQCLEVALEARQPVSIITKNALIVRDLDLLQQLAELQLLHVFLSITTASPELARVMEPGTSIPAARVRAVRELAAAGIPVGVMVAPVIPGINDSEIPSILQQAADAGAMTANYLLLRLPSTVEPVFVDWLRSNLPQHAEKVLGRLRSAREGQLNSAEWGRRMTGKGEIATQIGSMFRLFRTRFGLNRELPRHRTDLFRPPASGSGQQSLF